MQKQVMALKPVEEEDKKKGKYKEIIYYWSITVKCLFHVLFFLHLLKI